MYRWFVCHLWYVCVFLCVSICIHTYFSAKRGMTIYCDVSLYCNTLIICLRYLFMSVQAELPHAFYGYTKFQVWWCPNVIEPIPRNGHLDCFEFQGVNHTAYSVSCGCVFLRVLEICGTKLKWNYPVKECVFLLSIDISNCINLYSLQQWLNVPLPALCNISAPPVPTFCS